MSTVLIKPPYGLILSELRAKKVVPFLGAGVNFGSRQPDDEWKRNSNFLPSGKELSYYLADQIGLEAADKRDIEDLAKVASYYVDVDGVRTSLRQVLRGIFVREEQSEDFAPQPIHTLLAQEALYYEDGLSPYEKRAEKPKTKGTPLLIVTTNYDDLTEKAFIEAGRPYDLVVYPTDHAEAADSVLWWKAGKHDEGYETVPPNRLRIDLDRTNVIYKMHGSVVRQKPEMDSFVITEEDYVEFLARMAARNAVPQQFLRYFSSHRFLFLGYGLNDWNLRVVLRNLRSVLPKKQEQTPADAPALNQQDEESDDSTTPEQQKSNANLQSWAIQYNPSGLEEALWGARKVKIYNQPIDIFARTLKTFAEREDLLPKNPKQ